MSATAADAPGAASAGPGLRPASRLAYRSARRVLMLNNDNDPLGLTDAGRDKGGGPSRAGARAAAPGTPHAAARFQGQARAGSRPSSRASARPATPNDLPAVLGPSHSAPDVGYPGPRSAGSTASFAYGRARTTTPKAARKLRVGGDAAAARPPRPRSRASSFLDVPLAGGAGADASAPSQEILQEMLDISGTHLPSVLTVVPQDETERLQEKKAEETVAELDAQSAASDVFRLHDQLNQLKRGTRDRQQTLRQLHDKLFEMDYDEAATISEGEFFNSASQAWHAQRDEVGKLAEEQCTFDLNVLKQIEGRTRMEVVEAEKQVADIKRAHALSTKALKECRTRLAEAESEEAATADRVEKLIMREAERRADRAARLRTEGARLKSLVASHANKAEAERRRIQHSEDARRKMLEDLELQLESRSSTTEQNLNVNPIQRKVEMKRRAAFLRIQNATGLSDTNAIIARYDNRNATHDDIVLRCKNLEAYLEEKEKEVRELRQIAASLSNSGIDNQFRWKEFDNLETKVRVVQARKELASDRYIAQLRKITLSVNGLGEVLSRLGVDVRRDLLRVANRLGGGALAAAVATETAAETGRQATGEDEGAGENKETAGAADTVGAAAALAAPLEDAETDEEPHHTLARHLADVLHVLGQAYDLVEEQKASNPALHAVDLDGDGVSDGVTVDGDPAEGSQQSLPAYNTRIVHTKSKLEAGIGNAWCARAPKAKIKESAQRLARNSASARNDDSIWEWTGVDIPGEQSDSEAEVEAVDVALLRSASAESAEGNGPVVPRLQLDKSNSNTIANMMSRDRYVRQRTKTIGVNNTRSGLGRMRNTMLRMKGLTSIGKVSAGSGGD